MGLFNKLFGNKEKSDAVVTQQPFTRVKENTPVMTLNSSAAAVIDMSKSKENLNTVLIDMSKGSKIDMTKHIARVALAMDYSGSMDHLFDNGSVQRTISRLLPIALRFDDNGELESWLFSTDFKRLDAVTESNYENYVKKIMQKSGMCMGGTYYEPVLSDMVNYYKNIEPSEVPAFIIFITDGENMDKNNTNRIVRELSEYNIFVQFIGIGNERFNYLRSLDSLDGRKHDNTGFTAVKDMNKLDDQQLYTEILRQYKVWLNNKQ